MSTTIRKADITDLDKIHEIELECFGRDAFSKGLLEYFLRSLDCLTLVAAMDGQVVGFIVGSIDFRKGETACHIYTLDVRGNCRRKGFGTSLLSALEQALVKKGVESCYLEVRVDNTTAQNLYTKRGYKQQETIKDYYGFGLDGVRFAKRL